MNLAVAKTLELILLIALGFLLQKKVASKEGLKGLKTIILSVALPATIFLALLKIDLEASLFMLPLIALSFNLILFFIVKYTFIFIDPISSNARKRTANLLLPSLAPGLSCFPFIIAYLGTDYLAKAALADVGNKIFGLILLYLLAMYWYQKNAVNSTKKSLSGKLKNLLISLISEPINVVIVLALVMLMLGLNLSFFPDFIQNSIHKLGGIMVPLVLLFIGMSVRIKRDEIMGIFKLLLWRSGIVFLLTAVVVLLMPNLSPAMVVLLVVFPQSSCSFWPFAHMNVVNTLEEKDNRQEKTFDLEYAINILACSLPFSTLIILGVFQVDQMLVNRPIVLAGVGLVLVFVVLLYNVITMTKKPSTIEAYPKLRKVE